MSLEEEKNCKDELQVEFIRKKFFLTIARENSIHFSHYSLIRRNICQIFRIIRRVFALFLCFNLNFTLLTLSE